MSLSTGRCLCGKVSYSASLKPGAGACHCGMCRRWAGGPLMSVHAEGSVTVSGKEHLGTYSSSQWAERAFCKHCGSNLYYRLLPSEHFPEGEYIFTAGSLDNQQGLKFDHEVYVDHNPGWFQFAGNDDRKRLTEADIVAMYSAG